MARTTAALVAGILMEDYDGKSPLGQFIATANVITSRVASLGSDEDSPLSAEELELIERWLAAHCYAQSDKGLTSESIKGSSGQYAGQTTMGFNSTLYGQTAMRIDYTGWLKAIDEGLGVVKGFWAGKTKTEQTDYDDRN